MTHPTKPDRSTAAAVSEEDKARAMRVFLGDGSYTAGAPPWMAIAAEFTRIRAEAAATEREACAVLVEERRAGYASQMADVHSLAAAIRSRGEGDADEKG